MAYFILPIESPDARTMLGWDGVDFRALAVDTAGRVQSRGEDQIFSFQGPYIERVDGLAVGAGDQTLDSTLVGAGDIRVLTSIWLYNQTTVNTVITANTRIGLISNSILRSVLPVANAGVGWSGSVYLPENYYIRGRFLGCAAGDNIYMALNGYIMTLEA